MRALMILTMFALGACKAEPDFDERYDDATANIAERAKAIDAEIGDEADGEAAPLADCDPGSCDPEL